MALPFLDTNVILRHVLQDHQDFSARATAYIAGVERGEAHARTSDFVVLEVVFTLQRQQHWTKTAVRDAVLPLLELSGIVLPGKRRFQAVFDLYVNLNISFADAYHVVLMKRLGLTEVVSFDREFERVPGIVRTEP